MTDVIVQPVINQIVQVLQYAPAIVAVSVTDEVDQIIATTMLQVIDDPREVDVVERGLQGPRGPAGSSAGSVPPISFAYGDAAGIVYTAPSNGVFTVCRIDINTVFNGASPRIHVGIVGSIDALISYTQIDPTFVAKYEAAPDLFVTMGASVWLQIEPGAGATSGSGELLLNFTPE